MEPPIDPDRLRALRPWGLVLAMAGTWLLGIYGVTSGSATVSFLRQGDMPDLAVALAVAKASADPVEGLNVFRIAAEQRAVALHASVTMPLAIAKVLLGLVLVVGSAMMLAGRPRGRSVCLQAIVATGALSTLNFVLTDVVRQAWIADLVSASEVLALPEHLVDFKDDRFWRGLSVLQWVLFELAILIGAAAAVTSRGTSAYLAATAQFDAERRDHDDDEDAL